MNQVINSLGLTLNIIGVLLLFKFGPPQPDFQESVSLEIGPKSILADGTPVQSIIDHTKALKHKYEIGSRWALVLILVGFVLQLAAAWVG